MVQSIHNRCRQTLEENGWIEIQQQSEEFHYINSSTNQTLFFNVIGSLDQYYYLSFSRAADNTMILKLKYKD